MYNSALRHRALCVFKIIFAADPQLKNCAAKQRIKGFGLCKNSNFGKWSVWPLTKTRGQAAEHNY
jgi:hypothetical protein